MAIHKILYLPDPRLRKMSVPVEIFDQALQTLIDDMFETMYHVRGAGLAAPQIGVNVRLSVMDVSRDDATKQPIVLINPEIIAAEGTETFQEGCLSVPGAYETVERSAWVKVRALNRQGESFEMEGTGVLAECIQHEIDHLNGKLYVDLLSPLKRQRVLEKLAKAVRQMER